MKPLLILLPAPARWVPLSLLYETLPAAWLAELEASVTRAGDGAAFAVVPDGGHLLSAAWLQRNGPLGFLGHVLTRMDHRRRGYARRAVSTLLAWFDMSGGRWLYAHPTDQATRALLSSAGFEPLQRADDGGDFTMLKRFGGAPLAPLEDERQPLSVRELSRADWASMFGLLQRAAGPDARVSVAQSALAAEHTVLEWLGQSARGVTALLGAFRGELLVGIATCAIDQLGQRTYAMTIPHSVWPAESVLRSALLEYARGKGYAQVDFPLDALANVSAASSATG